MERMRRGFRLAGTSWRVLRQNPGLVALVAVGVAGFVLASLGLFVALLGRLPRGADFQMPRYLVVLPILGAGSLISTYCNAAVIVVARERLEGRPATLSYGLRTATAKLPQLVGWTLVSMTVGLFLQILAERLKVGGRVASWLLGLAWALATIFVIPVILFERAGLAASIRRSADLFRGRWGESVAATGAVGVAAMIVALPILLVGGVLLAVSQSLGVIVLVAGFAALMVVSGALSSVVNVALYRYAVDATVLGEFQPDDLANSYTPKKRRRRR